MTKAIVVLFLACAILTACSGDEGPAAQPPAGNVHTDAEEVFEGKLEKFQVEYVAARSGTLRGAGTFLAYQLHLQRNTGDHGDFNIYDCQESSCSRKSLIYKIRCHFSTLACQVTDGSGEEVKKGNRYKVDAKDVGDFGTIFCGDVGKTKFKNCSYLTLVDPLLRPQGYRNQYWAAEFVPDQGDKTNLIIFHLKSNGRQD